MHRFGNDARAHALLESRGYRPVRRYYRMEIELDGPPPDPAWPEGIEVRPYDDGEAAAFHAALDEAFAEEWGHEAARDVDWRAVRERRSRDRSLWFAVKDGGEIAAALVSDEEHWGVGWVHSIGVRPAWRRRGLGEALLTHSFAELYRRGRKHIGLGVDAENPTGATRLYERLGMHVASSFVYFEKDLGGRASSVHGARTAAPIRRSPSAPAINATRAAGSSRPHSSAFLVPGGTAARRWSRRPRYRFRIPRRR